VVAWRTFSVRGRPREVGTTTNGGVLRLFTPLEFSEDRCVGRLLAANANTGDHDNPRDIALTETRCNTSELATHRLLDSGLGGEAALRLAAATHKGGDCVMVPLTPGAQIDELRRVVGESEQRRQAAEVKLANRERRLATARQTIAAQDRRIGWLVAEVDRLRDAAASTVRDDYLRDAARFFNVYSIGSARRCPSTATNQIETKATERS
jgi:hypothetical protein